MVRPFAGPEATRHPAACQGRLQPSAAPQHNGPSRAWGSSGCGRDRSRSTFALMVGTRGPAEALHHLCPRRGDAGLIERPAPYYPTVKSILFSTVPDASLTSTCQAPVHSAGTVFRLHVRHGDPLTCSSTSPTSVSPWNHTWWIVVSLPAGAPLSLVQHTTWPTSGVNAEPVSWGARSTTDFATTASLTSRAGVAGGWAWVVCCAARVGAAASDRVVRIVPRCFMTALLRSSLVVRPGAADVPARRRAPPLPPSRWPCLRSGTSSGTRAGGRDTWLRRSGRRGCRTSRGCARTRSRWRGRTRAGARRRRDGGRRASW